MIDALVINDTEHPHNRAFRYSISRASSSCTLPLASHRQGSVCESTHGMHRHFILHAGANVPSRLQTLLPSF